jgi:hypothetical protein
LVDRRARWYSPLALSFRNRRTPIFVFARRKSRKDCTMKSPEFDGVMALIALLADPAAAKARLVELQAAINGAAEREAEANAAHAALEAERSRLAKLADDLRAREVKVHLTESKIAGDLEELRRSKQETANRRLVHVGAGLTREPDMTPVAPDPITDRFAEPMGNPAAAQVRRPSRVRA